METHDPRSIPELLSTLTSELANLVRKESELVRTEVGEKISQAVKAAVGVGAGGVLLLAALFVLLQALVLALSKFMDPLWATLIVGVIVAIIGYVVVQSGLKLMKPSNLAPDRSARQLNKDAQLVKGQVK